MATGAQPPKANLVDRLFDAAFNVARDPRSDEYKAGVRTALNYYYKGTGIRSPHAMGTAQADAFYAGVDEGHRLWRAHADASTPLGDGASHGARRTRPCRA